MQPGSKKNLDGPLETVLVSEGEGGACGERVAPVISVIWNKHFIYRFFAVS